MPLELGRKSQDCKTVMISYLVWIFVSVSLGLFFTYSIVLGNFMQIRLGVLYLTHYLKIIYITLQNVAIYLHVSVYKL